MTRLLIVDDDQSTLASLSRAFRLAGYEAVVCDNAARAITLLKSERFDLVFSDVVMPGKDGLTMLAEVRELGIATPIIMISGQATVDMAVRATRLGAVDFLEKPISSEKLLLTVENALKLARLEEENRQLRRRVGRHDIVWKSDAMRRVMAQVDRVAGTESRICILGRDRYRQGAGGARRPRAQRSSREAFCDAELRGGAVRVDRIRAVRSRERVASPEPPRGISANSSRRTAARCFSTRSATCRRRCRPSCCACCRRASSNASAASGRSSSTHA